jgi:hypothetical protein
LDGSPPAGLYARGPEREFRQEGFYPGFYRVSARGREWFLTGVELHGEPCDPERVPITSSVDDLVIRLSDHFARVEGLIRSTASLAASARFTVTLTSGDRKEIRPTDQNGKFVFERLVPGDYQICARRSDAPGDSPCAIERRFPAEAGSEVELDLSAPQ